jgi:hypothetical protein
MSVCYELRRLQLSHMGNFDPFKVVEDRSKFKALLQKNERVLATIMNPGLRDSGAAQVAVQRLGVRIVHSYVDTKDYCPNIFGCASRSQIKAAEQKLSTKNIKHDLRSRSQRPMLAVPFRDLPNRLVGYTLIDRDEVELRPDSLNCTLKIGQYSEDGVACHPSLFFENRGSILITTNVFIAVQLWSKAAFQNYTKLPLVAAKEQTSCWQLFGDKFKIVLAFGKADLSAIRLAVRLDCLLYVAELKGTFEKWMHNLRVSRLHKTAQSDKKHWTEAIASVVNKMQLDEASEYLLKLGLQPDELDRLKQTGNTKLIKAIRYFGSTNHNIRSVNYRSGVIEQSAGAWYFCYKNKKEQISNAIITLKEIINYGNQSIATVIIHYHEKVVEFQVDYEEFQSNTFKIIHNQCLKNQFTFVVPKHWQSALHSVMLHFYKPDIREGDAFVGYDHVTRSWTTPTHTVVNNKIYKKPPMPAWIDIPGSMRVKNAGWTKHIRGSSPVVVASIIAAVKQATCSAVGAVKPPLFFTGHTSLLCMRELAEALGAMVDVKDVHDWFVVKKSINESTKQPSIKQIDQAYIDSAWMLVTDAQRCFGAFNGAMSLHDAGNELFVPQNNHREYLATAFLYLLKHWHGETDIVDYCLKRLATRNIHFVKKSIEACLHLDVDPCTALVALLKEIQSRGTLLYGTDAEVSKKTNVVRTMPDKRTVIVPTAVIERAINSMSLGTYDSVKIIYRLSKSPSYKGFDRLNGMQGWLIDKLFFDQAINDKRIKVDSFQLRIVG